MNRVSCHSTGSTNPGRQGMKTSLNQLTSYIQKQASLSFLGADIMTRPMITVLTTLAALAGGTVHAQDKDKPATEVKGQYAVVNGVKMYYELHGTGKPLVILHGAFGFATTYPVLAKGRQQIAVELQGHGHTADVDRPISIEQMADDVAELLKHLKIERADVFGYSMGGNVALGLAVRHPDKVGRVAITGSYFRPIEEAFEPESVKLFKSLPADFAPPVLKDPYDKVAPDPKQWPVLVSKVKTAALEWKGFTRDQMKAIKAPVLITLGDRDGTRPEHAVEMFRLIPDSKLAIFPGGDHFLLQTSPATVLTPVAAFLDAPAAGTK
jgi:pimeloyl-ACP methyl ester carboxylesterase